MKEIKMKIAARHEQLFDQLCLDTNIWAYYAHKIEQAVLSLFL